MAGTDPRSGPLPILYVTVAALTTLLPALGASTAAGAEPSGPLRRGHIFFETGFEGVQALAGWSGARTLDVGRHGGNALLIERAGDAAGSAFAQLRLPVEAMRGCVVYGSAWIKAEGVTTKPRPWNGIKLMMPLDGPSGKSWPNAEIGTGTFDWMRFEFAARVPPDATAASLALGLEMVSGRAWFDEVKILAGRPPAASNAKPCAVRHRGHDLPRLRGTMVGGHIDEPGLRVLGREWNANVLRWQMTRPSRNLKSDSLAAWEEWFNGELAKVDAALPLCRSNGLYMVLDLHSPPGGRATAGGYLGSDAGLFRDRAAQEQFVDAWRRMARRYRGNRVIWGFDLANEPVEGVVADDCEDWHDLAERAAKAIRSIDPDRTLIVEPPDWGSPAGLRDFPPIDVPGVVYSVHMYLPHSFTHQGVHGPGGPVAYPGEIDGRQWDKETLRAALQPVVDFQKANNVHIYIGEFSAIRWAPDHSAFRYLRDAIDVFEENGWDWTYHAFREWQGWSAEHGEDKADPAPSPTPTDRQRLLQDWFAKNARPVFPER